MGFQRFPLKIVEWIANDLKGEAAGSGALKKARRGQPRSVVALIADQQNF
ncbi:MAG: hypothetical protein HOL51_27700 [Gemmatimonadetes bacterium]|jgi:hypothetical protein|nr:hypothetical protein [Gemmatimonadota bacterium]MBT5329905.1 hypothetical protein [Gemmatimonadota bacterium]MBT5449893.1 hypothetical protein [Gemmatimonadota bacterium]MBT5804714.1 hypothetical protein [Gemmatimonadota bacterium]MBT6622324.1 hypothetical protein [Gemmatimonadota bacterium]